MDEVGRTLREQDGVISRRQALELGETPAAIRRSLRRRAWVTVHPGVYVDHTGLLTWQQRAWAAVLYAAPAALTHESALRAAEGPGRTGEDYLIHVAFGRDRRVGRLPGVRWHRVADLDSRVEWSKRPPRVGYEETVLDLASVGSRLAAVGRLADACGSRRTKASRLRDRLDDRPWIRQREWLRSVLSDIADGTCSVLEHGYLDLVERPHGLPPGQRQRLRRGSNGHVYRDVDYDGLRLVVELDGKLFHSSTADRDRDLERDLDAAVIGTAMTLRLGFGQVYERGCATALKVAAVMQRLGWRGRPASCRSCQPVGSGPDVP